jgi:dolichol-phosphate mannosyltransferase
MSPRTLTALPVYNEARHLPAVLPQVLRYSQDVLVVDDGSTDATPSFLVGRSDTHLIRHAVNQGYGAALRSAFAFAREKQYDILVTIDCDGQHEPQRIPDFIAACTDEVDIVSGSRYLESFAGDSAPPEQRRRINHILTAELNRELGLTLTDAFCGFKAYRVAALARLELTETGYAMPLELWVQAVAAGLRTVELPVPLIYLDEARSFGGALDNADLRLQVYRDVFERSLAAVRRWTPPMSVTFCGE